MPRVLTTECDGCSSRTEVVRLDSGSWCRDCLFSRISDGETVIECASCSASAEYCENCSPNTSTCEVCGDPADYCSHHSSRWCQECGDAIGPSEAYHTYCNQPACSECGNAIDDGDVTCRSCVDDKERTPQIPVVVSDDGESMNINGMSVRWS